MFEKLKNIEANYLSLREKLYDPNINSDPQKTMEISKKMAGLEDIYNLYQEYKTAYDNIEEAKEMINTEKDTDIIELAKQQLSEGRDKEEELVGKLRIALLPKDPNDDKNIFLEVRPAAGGDEAGLFAGELFRMYLRYAELKEWKIEIIENVSNDIGGLKFATVKISGDKIFSKLKFESGVHRVQRIPETESGGRIHTSTVTVAIMPEIDDVEINIRSEDIEMDTYAASSAGGQHANKNETGVRLTHKPSGIVVTCGDSRSQLQNREKAMTVLKAKIYQIELEKQQSSEKETRANQIGTGDRSEKIRTYNFPQDRVTDHRIKKSWSNLPSIMQGYIDDIINDIVMENQAMLLSKSED